MAFALAAQVSTVVFTAALTVFLVRALGPGGYGVLALAVGIGSVLVLLSDFGISPSAARFVAERRGDRPAVGAVLAEALRLKLVMAGLVAVVLGGLAGPIAAAYDAPALAWPLRAVAISLFGQTLMLLFVNAFVALGRISLRFWVVLSESAMEASASVALVVLSGGATAAAFGRAIGYVLAALGGLFLLARLVGLRTLSIPGRSPVGRRRIVGYAGALLIIDGAFALFSAIDVLVIGAILGTTSAGLYSAPLRLTAALSYPGLAVSQVVAPRLARHAHHAPDVQALQSALRYLLIVQAAIVAPIVVWAAPIVDLTLGSGYSESTAVLRGLAPYIFLLGPVAVISVGVNYLGEARRRVPIAVAALVINIAIDLVLIPEIGIVAGAIGTDVAFLVYAGGHVWICRRLIDLRLRPLGVTLARSLAAGGGMALVLWLFGTRELSPLEWVAGGTGGLLAFLAVLVATRELSVGELGAALRRGIGTLRRAAG